jgi:hypothetical protein
MDKEFSTKEILDWLEKKRMISFLVADKKYVIFVVFLNLFYCSFMIGFSFTGTIRSDRPKWLFSNFLCKHVSDKKMEGKWSAQSNGTRFAVTFHSSKIVCFITNQCTAKPVTSMSISNFSQ